MPSVPIQTLGPRMGLRLDLSTNSPSPVPGESIVLVATAGASVTGTGDEIEIFDITTRTLVGSCAAGSQCVVAYAAKSGTHTFEASITPPTKDLPSSPLVTSNRLSARWMAVSLSANTVAIGPGKPITVTATSSVSFQDSPYVLQIYDVNTSALVASCSMGVSCSVTVTSAQAQVRNFIADLARPSSTFPPDDAQAQSQLLPVTWLSVSLHGTTSGQVGSAVYLTAMANGDLTNTPWSIGIFDGQGHLVAPACKTGNACTVQVMLPSGDTPHYTAAIGSVPSTKPASSLLDGLVRAVLPIQSMTDVQARSADVQPSRLLWGVDSCKTFTEDPLGVSGLYPQVVGSLGTPDFWGRYLTDTVCPGISWAEISAAYRLHMGILPIYNDYDCSDVVGYPAGVGYARAAVAAAQFLHIPAGRALAIDIEPAGAACPGAMYIDAGFIHGWYDGITAARYVPVYYGNGTADSFFGASWCVAAQLKPALMTNAYVWSFEPSLTGSFNRGTAPSFSPNQPGCPANVAAWQYSLSAGSTPDVDHDEALSSLPLWYPTPW